MAAIGINEQRIGQRVGSYVYLPNAPQPHNCIVASSVIATAPLKAGTVVALDSTNTNTNCPVVKAAAVTDAIYGVIVYDSIKDAYIANDKVAVAIEGSTIYMPAAGAVTPGAELYFNTSGQVTATATAGNSIIGTANNYAAAANDLVQVKLKFAKTQAASE